MWKIFTKSKPADDLSDKLQKEAEKIAQNTVRPILHLRLWKVEDKRHPALDPRVNDRLGPMHVTSVDLLPGGKIHFLNLDNTDKTAWAHTCTLPEWQAWASNYLTEHPDTAVYVFDKWVRE